MDFITAVEPETPPVLWQTHGDCSYCPGSEVRSLWPHSCELKDHNTRKNTFIICSLEKKAEVGFKLWNGRNSLIC